MNPLPVPLLKFLLRYTLRKFKRGQIMLFQGEVPRSAYIIKKGVVRIFTITNQGDERIIALLSPGDFLAVGWLFDKAPVALYYYDAFTDCDVYSVPKSDLKEFIRTEPDSVNKILERYITLYVGATLHINALEHSKAQDKLLRTLQYLMMRHGKKLTDGLVEIDLRLTHQDFAKMTGLTRETVAVELNKMKKKKLISYKHKNYTLNPSELLSMLGSDEFTTVKL